MLMLPAVDHISTAAFDAFDLLGITLTFAADSSRTVLHGVILQDCQITHCDRGVIVPVLRLKVEISNFVEVLTHPGQLEEKG